MTLFLTRTESAALRRCISMLQVSRSGFALSLLLGVTALGSAIALGGTAAWLIARASQQPPVLYLTVAATAVRLFGVSRALARYLSRLASHKVALAGMDALRGNLYDRLSEAPTATLTSLRRGDLMTRAGSDVDEVGNVVVKTLLPSLVALIVGVGTVGVVAAFLRPRGDPRLRAHRLRHRGARADRAISSTRRIAGGTGPHRHCGHHTRGAGGRHRAVTGGHSRPREALSRLAPRATCPTLLPARRACLRWLEASTCARWVQPSSVPSSSASRRPRQACSPRCSSPSSSSSRCRLSRESPN